MSRKKYCNSEKIWYNNDRYRRRSVGEKGAVPLRLDKMLSECGIATRKETQIAVRAGAVTVDGHPAARPDVQIDPSAQSVIFRGTPIRYRKFVYLMLNKPDGYVSATEDGKDPVVTDLLPEEYRRRGVFPCGRLDKHTLGLMLLTDDGELSHRLLSPKSHVTKSYDFRVKFPLSEEDRTALEAGVDIGGYLTKPCRMEIAEDRLGGTIFLTEGKYHQIKLMMEAVHNQITALERKTFGSLVLDPALERGAWRELTEEEEAELKRNPERNLATK